jgi:hypothetical protein
MHDAFAFHKLNEQGQAQANAIAILFSDLLQKIEPSHFDPRTAALARTKLEEACFFAKKSMAMNPNYQDNG